MIVKTKNPANAKTIISRPSGDNPYYLVNMPQGQVESQHLRDDVVEDTAAFFSQYDLGGEKELQE